MSMLRHAFKQVGLLGAAVLLVLLLVGCVPTADEVAWVRVERTRPAGGGWWKERQDLSQTQREAVIKDALRRFNEQETIQGARTGPVSFVVPGDYRSVLLAPRFEGFNEHGGYVLSFDCHKGHEDRVFDYLCGVIDAALLDSLPGAGRDGRAWAPQPILAIYNRDSAAADARVLEARLRPLVGEFLEAHAEFKECSVSVRALT